MQTNALAGPRALAPTFAGPAGAAGGAFAGNNASAYYGQGAGTAGQVAGGLGSFLQGGQSLLGFGGGGGGDAGGGGGGGEGGGSINPMPKFNSPILAKAQSKSSSPSEGEGELSSAGGSKKKLASIFDDDGGGDGGGYEE